MSVPSPFRYPGGKTRLLSQIMPYIVDREHASFADLFVGGGSVALAVASELPSVRVVMNDLHPDIAAFWSVVVSDPGDLSARVRAAQPTVDEFRALKDNAATSPTDRAYRALYLNRCSFSGIGERPIGGYEQTSKWAVDCRWNGERTANIIDAAHSLLRRRTTVTCVPAWQGEWADRVYLDPPYYGKGPQLYEQGMDQNGDEHSVLADTLRSESDWVLSYDDHPVVRSLYEGWTTITSLEKKGYSISGTLDAKKRANAGAKPELIITPARRS